MSNCLLSSEAPRGRQEVFPQVMVLSLSQNLSILNGAGSDPVTMEMLFLSSVQENAERVYSISLLFRLYSQ